MSLYMLYIYAMKKSRNTKIQQMHLNPFTFPTTFTPRVLRFGQILERNTCEIETKILASWRQKYLQYGDKN